MVSHYNYLFVTLLLIRFSMNICLPAFAVSRTLSCPSCLSTLVGPSGLEPPTSCLSGTRSNHLSYEPMWFFRGSTISRPIGGDDGTRTHDPLLAKQVLSQLSYTPMTIGNHPFPKVSRTHRSAILGVGFDLSSRTVASEVLSALQSLTSVFGMGTGGPSALRKPTDLSIGL